MRKRNNIGIYMGENFVSAALTEGMRLIALSKCQLSTLGEASETEILSEAVLWEAAINKCMRDLKVEKKEVLVSLADKDFIFRCFEMPLMNRKEIEASLGFELEKFIPFKMEDLIWDYRFTRNVKERKVNLSFLGMKSTIYKQYRDLFSRLDIKVLNMEPSAISLVRTIKNQGYAKKIENFALLDFSETETYITFFQQDLPIFNRFLSVGQRGGVLMLDKLIEEVRISIQYFRREFRGNVLDKLFILGSAELTAQFEGVGAEIDIDISIIDPGKILGSKDVGPGDVKAYAVAVSNVASYKFTPILKEAEESLMVRERMLWDVPLNVPMIVGAAGLGLAGCIVVSLLAGKKTAAARAEFAHRTQDAGIPAYLEDKSLKELEGYYNGQNTKLEKVKSEIEGIVKVSPFMARLPFLLDEGIWFREFSLENKNDGLTVLITGNVFLGDMQRERETFNAFITRLREDADFKRYFKRVDLLSTQKTTVEGYDTFSFSIRLES